MSLYQQMGAYAPLASFILLFISIKLLQSAFKWRNTHLTLLRGPPNTSLLFGRSRETFFSDDKGIHFEQWAKEYGSVYKVPNGLGMNAVVLCDPKAITHFHARDGFTYLRQPFFKTLMQSILGDSMLSADKDDHKRQRRNMSPAFTISALRGTTNIFYDSAYKAKAYWCGLFERNSEIVIDVQDWMNRLTLDSIGIAGFGHDFKTLEGHKSPVTDAFESMNTAPITVADHLFLLVGTAVPSISKIPSKQTRLFKQLREALSEIAHQLIQQSGGGNGASENVQDRSILGQLLKGQSGAGIKISHEEVLGQGLVVFAGYETTAISLSWALVELSRNQDVQEKLREELRQFSADDPTWDQLTYGLPYLDAITHETLRLHPPVEEITRVAGEDSSIPLSSPVTLATGETVDAISIQKGTALISPITFINRCETFWGPDAKQFVPDKWLSENACKAKDLVGHRRLYTFADGPRMCLGKLFALAEFKAILSVLIRNFSFELPDGPETKVAIHRTLLLPRPKTPGEGRSVLRMRVRQIYGR